MDRAPGFEPVGRRFESCRARQIIHLGRVAQLAEQLTLNQLVEGSSPSTPTRKIKDLGDVAASPFLFELISLPILSPLLRNQ